MRRLNAKPHPRACLRVGLFLFALFASGRALGEAPPTLFDWEQLLLGGPPRGSAFMRLHDACTARVLRLDARYQLPYRSDNRESLNSFDSLSGEAMYLSRWNEVHFGLLIGRRDIGLSQENSYSDDDRMKGGAKVDFALAACSLRRGAWQGLLFGGRGEGWEGGGALSLTGNAGRLTLMAGFEDLPWAIDQAFGSRRYIFRFPLRREYLRGAFEARHPESSRLPSFGYEREVDVGRETEAPDHNDLYISRHSARLDWPASGPRQLRFRYGKGRLGLNMYADDVQYLSLRSLHFRKHSLEIVPFADPRLGELLLGVEEMRFRSSGRPYFEPWPFSFWFVFKHSRYRLSSLDYRLTAWSLGYGREFGGGNLTMKAALRHVWFVGGGAVLWKERVSVLPPFFFDWKGHREVLPLPAISVLRLDLSGRFTIASSWRANWALAQYLPLREVKRPGTPGPSIGDGPAGYTYGGLQARLSLERVFR